MDVNVAKFFNLKFPYFRFRTPISKEQFLNHSQYWVPNTAWRVRSRCDGHYSLSFFPYWSIHYAQISSAEYIIRKTNLYYLSSLHFWTHTHAHLSDATRCSFILNACVQAVLSAAYDGKQTILIFIGYCTPVCLLVWIIDVFVSQSGVVQYIMLSADY